MGDKMGSKVTYDSPTSKRKAIMEYDSQSGPVRVRFYDDLGRSVKDVSFSSMEKASYECHYWFATTKTETN